MSGQGYNRHADMLQTYIPCQVSIPATLTLVRSHAVSSRQHHKLSPPTPTPQPTPVTQQHSQSQSVPVSFFLGGESEVTPAAPRLSKRRASEKVSVTVKQVCNSHNTAQRNIAVSTTPHNIAQHTAHLERGIFVILCINYIKPLLQSLIQSQPWLNITNLDRTGNLSYCLTSLLTC